MERDQYCRGRQGSKRGWDRSALSRRRSSLATEIATQIGSQLRLSHYGRGFAIFFVGNRDEEPDWATRQSNFSAAVSINGRLRSLARSLE